MKYILSIGTNIGDRMKNIIRSIDAINSIPYTDVIAKSSVYRTQPVGYARQDDFYNVCVEVESQLEPGEMLGVCLGIEAGFGRIRAIPNGPRIMDIDIIFAENYTCHSRNLIIPHPRYSERRFVLQPLLEMYPGGEVYGIRFGDYIDSIEGQAVEKISEPVGETI